MPKKSMKLKPLKKVTGSIIERVANVVSYCSFGVSNAVAELINNELTAIKRRGDGF